MNPLDDCTADEFNLYCCLKDQAGYGYITPRLVTDSLSYNLSKHMEYFSKLGIISLGEVKGTKHYFKLTSSYDRFLDIIVTQRMEEALFY